VLIAAAIVTAVIGVGLAVPRTGSRPAARLRGAAQRRDPPDLPRPAAVVTRREALRTRRLVLAVGLAAAGVAGFGPRLGAVIGLCGAVGAVVVLGRSPVPTAAPDEAALVIDLIAGCLEAGVPLGAALDAAAAAADPVTAVACRTTSSHTRSWSSGWLSKRIKSNPTVPSVTVRKLLSAWAAKATELGSKAGIFSSSDSANTRSVWALVIDDAIISLASSKRKPLVREEPCVGVILSHSREVLSILWFPGGVGTIWAADYHQIHAEITLTNNSKPRRTGGEASKVLALASSLF